MTVFEDTRYNARGIKYRIDQRKASGVDAAGFFVMWKSRTTRNWGGGFLFPTIELAQAHIAKRD